MDSTALGKFVYKVMEQKKRSMSISIKKTVLQTAKICSQCKMCESFFSLRIKAINYIYINIH